MLRQSPRGSQSAGPPETAPSSCLRPRRKSTRSSPTLSKIPTTANGTTMQASSSLPSSRPISSRCSAAGMAGSSSSWRSARRITRRRSSVFGGMRATTSRVRLPRRGSRPTSSRRRGLIRSVRPGNYGGNRFTADADLGLSANSAAFLVDLRARPVGDDRKRLSPTSGSRVTCSLAIHVQVASVDQVLQVSTPAFLDSVSVFAAFRSAVRD